MNKKILKDVASKMVAYGKGILAIDESHGTCEKRFKALNVAFNEQTRQNYRQMLVTTEGIEEAVAGYILFDETIRQKTDDGKRFVDVLSDKGILSGIKVDKGAKDLALFPGEKVTEGLDGLRERLIEYKKLGASFAKWRAVITIDEENNLPTQACISANTHALARYAALCQEIDIVPMVEPEILLDGNHSLETCREVSQKVWSELFKQLELFNVYLPGTILKTSMVLPGKDSQNQVSDEVIARETIESFKKVVPEDLAGIVFLSGGQSAKESTDRLLKMHELYKDLPWPVSFSYGRGIQQPALELWAKDQVANYKQAQQALLERALANGEAVK